MIILRSERFVVTRSYTPNTENQRVWISNFFGERQPFFTYSLVSVSFFSSREGAIFFPDFAGGFASFGDLPGGKFGKGSENQFGFAHMIAQVLVFQSFQVFVFFDRYARPFLMDNVGQDGVFVIFALRPCCCQYSLARSSERAGSLMSWMRS